MWQERSAICSSDVTTPQALDERFRKLVGALRAGAARWADGPVRAGTSLTGEAALRLFDAQVASRHLDFAARWLCGFGEGHATLDACGYEGSAAVAAAVRPTDPALLHDQSSAFSCARAQQAGDATALLDTARDVLRGVVGSAHAPGSGGRHPLGGNPALALLPTTPAVAAHLPRAVGLGLAIERHRRTTTGRLPSAALGPRSEPPWPADAIVVCSFGEAAVNHASAVAAFNTVGWCDHSGVRIPVLFVCADAGCGVGAPTGWVATALRAKPGIRYFSADGCDLAATYDTAVAAVEWVRRTRRPALLHLTAVRLIGHATDAERGQRRATEIERDLSRDPLVATARLLAAAGLASGEDLVARYDELGWKIRRIAEEVLAEPKLDSAREVAATIAPRRPVRVAREVADAGSRIAGPLAATRAAVFDGRLPEQRGPLTLAEAINAALVDALLAFPGLVIFGEDVAATGGVHGVTRGLRERFGPSRVFDTLRDETSVLGLGIGAALAGMLPVPEIPVLAHLHHAEHQVREAAMTQFLSRGAFRAPMVLRVPGLATPDSVGGSVSDNALATLRDIPGLVLAVPARPDDAAAMLRSCVASAAVDGSVCVVVEPIALYHVRDLYEEGDNAWLAPYAAPGEWGERHVPIGRARVYGIGSGEELTMIAFGSGVRLALRAATRLAADEGVGVRVVDLRWLAPLPVPDIVREASATGRVLIVDETRRSGGVGEGVLAALVDAGFVGAVRRVAAVDSFVPLGPAARHVLVTEDAITQGARALLAR